jgi:hypothetical protein
MITVQLLGGLGNQLFQYAAGLALSTRLGVALQLDGTWFGTRQDRWYALEPFSTSGRLATAGDLRAAGIHHPGRLERGFAKLGFRLPPRIRGRVVEPGFTYWKGFEDLGDGAYLAGYWQSERYFSSIAPGVRAELALRKPPDPENQAVLDEIRGCEAVAFHVRRGDYVQNARTNRIHGTTTLDYYAAAAARVLAVVRDPVFFVFSDDPEWTQANLRFDRPARYVTHNGSARDYEDLRLMSACRHHVIANSSFSWWGAWLAGGAGQKVIAPRQWFRDGPDTRDLVPARWERL